jgi:amino acid permease
MNIPKTNILGFVTCLTGILLSETAKCDIIPDAPTNDVVTKMTNSHGGILIVLCIAISFFLFAMLRRHIRHEP